MISRNFVCLVESVDNFSGMYRVIIYGVKVGFERYACEVAPV